MELSMNNLDLTKTKLAPDTSFHLQLILLDKQEMYLKSQAEDLMPIVFIHNPFYRNLCRLLARFIRRRKICFFHYNPCIYKQCHLLVANI